jgi:hypothetical protein
MLSFRELKIFKGFMRILFTLILIVLVQLALSTGPDRTWGGAVDDSREAPGTGIILRNPAPAGDANSGALPRDLARFRVIPVTGAGITPVSVSLEGINYNTDKGRIALYEPGGREIPSQVERGIVTRIWFMYDNKEGGKTYVIRLVDDENTIQGSLFIDLDENNLTLRKGAHPVLSYRHSVMLPPEGVDEIFGRSGFIHPLRSPGGEVLTRVQPPDHWHHYGIWNPWTAATFEGRTVDFWNLGGGQGTVRFAGFTGNEAGPLFAGMKALQEHVAFSADGGELVAINELWDIRLWETNIKDITVLDFTSILNSPLSGGIVLDQFRYGGGLGYRTTEKWHKDNSIVLTSEGLGRAEADGTNARWCIIEGETDVPSGRSGILFLSHPSNRMHPEPMRVWPLDMYERGDLFFQFTPIRHEGWKLAPNTSYTQKYRLIVYDGEIAAEEAENFWRSFAVSPVINFLE